MSEKGFKFSIIMAIYDCEDYLNEAIDSLINQSLDFKENVQLILVNDESRDSSGEIALEYQKEYPENIMILSQEHSGVAHARNLGLKHAKGKYINFLDADDCISEDTLSEVSAFLDNNDCDVVAVPITYFERKVEFDSFNYKFDKTTVIDLMSNPNNPQFSISSTFIRADAVGDDFSTDIVCSEDLLFLYNIFLEKPKLGVLSAPTYFYRKRRDLSAISDYVQFTKEYYIQRLDGFHLKLIEISKENSEIPKFIQYLLIYDLEGIVTQEDYFMCDGEAEKEELLSRLRKILSYIEPEVIKTANMGDSLRYFFFNLAYDDLKVNFDNFDSVIEHDGEIVDSLHAPELIFKEFDLIGKSIKIAGFLNDYLDEDLFSVESLSEYVDGKIERHSADFQPDPSFRKIPHSSIYQNLKYFTLDIPFDENISTIDFKVVYHKNDMGNYRDEDLLVFDPKIESISKNTILTEDKIELTLNGSQIIKVGQLSDDALLDEEESEPHFMYPQIVAEKPHDFKFAVVMAIYNTEDYLNKSIDSVINQTLGFEDNVQLILVNDGSEDSCEEICLKYLEKYPDNVVVISGQNHGQAHARNMGFEQVRAKYTNFLDSDDYLEENALKEAYDFFEMHYGETDIVSMPIVFFEKKSGSHMLNNKFSSSRIIDLTSEPNNPQLSASSAFFKTDVLSRFKFPTNVISSEDSIVVNKILLEKRTLGVIDTSRYFCRKRFDESSTLDGAATKKEFFTDKLRDYYLHLFDYSLSKTGKIPDFLKYTLAYDLQWLLKEDLTILNNLERKEFWHCLREVIRYIDEEMILNNEYIRNEFTMRFFLSLKRNDLHAQYRKDNVLLEIGNHRCGNLASHNLWLDIVELRDGFLDISGFLNSLFDIENISIEAIKYWDDVEFDRFRAEYVKYTSRPHMTYLSVPFQFKNTFDLKIPLDPYEECTIKLKINYHKDGNNMNFARGNIISVDPGIAFTDHVRISKLSNYKADESHIVYFEDNEFHAEPSTLDALNEFEQNNIESIINKKENHDGKDLEVYNEIIGLRTDYLNQLSKRKLFSRKKEIYLFHCGDLEYDNAYQLFKYASKIRDNVNKYLVVSSGAKRFEKLSKLGNVVEEGSPEHKSLIIQADKIITTLPGNAQINPFGRKNRDLILGLLSYRTYWLPQEVTKDNISNWMRKYDNDLSLILTVSERESESFYGEGYGFDKSIVQNLGFPRFDNLKSNANKQILIIPSWRNAIDGNKRGFLNSSYFRNLNSFLHSPRLLDMIDKGYRIVFRPPPESFKDISASGEKFVDLFDVPDEIHLSRDESYRELLNGSSVMITDFSSLFFDFAYPKKPIIYFHPENDGCSPEGSYFDYETQGFGEVLQTSDNVLEKLEEYVENGCRMEDKYAERVDDFFTYSDKDNCKRVYDWILKN